MIHADTIEDVANEQVELWQKAGVLGDQGKTVGYFRNLGVCPDCLQVSALMISCAPDTGEPDEPHVTFTRGFVIGLLLGRTHPA